MHLRQMLLARKDIIKEKKKTQWSMIFKCWQTEKLVTLKNSGTGKEE